MKIGTLVRIKDNAYEQDDLDDRQIYNGQLGVVTRREEDTRYKGVFVKMLCNGRELFFLYEWFEESKQMEIGELVRVSPDGVYLDNEWRGALALVIEEPGTRAVRLRRLSDGAESYLALYIVERFEEQTDA